MKAIKFNKDPDIFIHSSLLSKLQKLDIISENENSLALFNYIDISKINIKDTAKLYKNKYGDFHKSYYNQKQKYIIRHYLFWSLRYKESSKIKISKEAILKSFENGISFIIQKGDVVSEEFVKCYNQTMQEYHRLIGFIKLDAFENDVLYGYLETDFDIVDIILNHFKKRYPKNNIVLKNYDQIYFSKDAVQFDILESKKIQDTEISKLFKVYYDSQYIKERKNIRLMQHFIPKKFWKWIELGDKLEKHSLE